MSVCSSPSTFSGRLFVSRTFYYLKHRSLLNVLYGEMRFLNEPSVPFSFSRFTTVLVTAKATVVGKVSETFLRYQIVLLHLKLHIYLSVMSATTNVEMSYL